ncbi:MAG: acyl-CoA dehydrogenase family protein, partial [Alphaproteobacteria bacterium]|nr:acyl-CoA dehydrogenase family protein [Alphaproteobacteria bacterium]
MDFLTPEQEMWRETVFRFMEEEVGRDYVREKDRNREYPYEGYAKIVSQGWIGLLVPEERGGQGGDIFAYALMCEGLARYGPDFATALMVPMFTAQNIVHHGTPEQAARYIEPFLAGEMRFVISLSEPQAGSDAANARTRA